MKVRYELDGRPHPELEQPSHPQKGDFIRHRGRLYSVSRVDHQLGDGFETELVTVVAEHY